MFRWLLPFVIAAIACGRVGFDSHSVDDDGGGTETALRQLVAGEHSTCAVLEGGVKCWGHSEFGRLGLPSKNVGDHPGEMGDALPTIDLGGDRVIDFGTGEDHTCALMDSGAVKCWGSAFFGELGTGDRDDRGDRAEDMGASLVTVDLGVSVDPVALEVYENHNCVLLGDGTVKCWGRNHYGILGLGDSEHRGDDPGEMGANLPTVDLGPSRTVADLSTGDHFNCAVFDDGAAKCWGRSTYGQLGLGVTNNHGDHADELGDDLPVLDLGTGRSVKSIASGKYHSCAILDDDTLKCWGRNAYGQLGLAGEAAIGDTPGEMGDALPTIDLGTGRYPLAITAGERHSCALLDDETVKCWGRNSDGQLGLGDTNHRGDDPGEMGDALPAIDLGSTNGVLAIAAGGDMSCAKLGTGAWKCWGDNTYGQLGLGDTDNRGSSSSHMGANLPVLDLGTGVDVVAIRAEEYHACALLGSGDLKCWGRDQAGQLGLGNNAARGDESGEMGAALPFLSPGGRPVTTMTRAAEHACVLHDDGSASCWGRNDKGQLGLGDELHRGDTPGELDALPLLDLSADSAITSLSMGSLHSCAVLDDTWVKCWGYNTSGRLGLGDSDHRGNEPGEMGENLLPVDLDGAAIEVHSGGFWDACFSCALMADRTVKCWGINGDGQLGLEHTSAIGDSPSDMGANLPAVELRGEVHSLATGGFHTCVVLADGSVQCWGKNDYGQLGLGDDDVRGNSGNEMGENLPFVDLGTGVRATTVSLGRRHSCALLEGGAVKCWGRNQYGQLGIGDTEDRGDNPDEMGDALPTVDLGTDRTAVAISAWSTHTCALLDNGDAKCWGANHRGQLGQEDAEHRGDEPGEMGDALRPIALW